MLKQDFWMPVIVLLFMVAFGLDRYARRSDLSDLLIGLCFGLSLVVNLIYIYQLGNRKGQTGKTPSKRANRR
jgi:hypothetical protein